MKMKLFVISAIAVLVATTNVFAETDQNAQQNTTTTTTTTSKNAAGDSQTTTVDQNGTAQ
jgi:hypothetical protein